MEQEQKSTPVKKPRSCKLTKEQTEEKLKEIQKELLSHIGQPAILFVKESRDMVPYFVELLLDGNTVVARYKCYSPEGKFRCYLKHYPNCVSLMIGEQRIRFFGEI